jgi:hypothetical protein
MSGYTHLLPEAGQFLTGKYGLDFLTLWPYRDGYAALDGTEQAREGSLGVVSSNRALTRAEALVEIEQWQHKGADLTLKLDDRNGDYGIWYTEATDTQADADLVRSSGGNVRSMIDQIKASVTKNEEK